MNLKPFTYANLPRVNNEKQSYENEGGGGCKKLRSPGRFNSGTFECSDWKSRLWSCLAIRWTRTSMNSWGASRRAVHNVSVVNGTVCTVFAGNINVYLRRTGLYNGIGVDQIQLIMIKHNPSWILPNLINYIVSKYY